MHEVDTKRVRAERDNVSVFCLCVEATFASAGTHTRAPGTLSSHLAARPTSSP